MPERKTVSQCVSSDYCMGWNDAVDAMPKWISVEDKLPEIGRTVICCAKGHIPIIGTSWYDAHRNMWHLDFVNKRAITHWMPLPSCPKEEI